MRVQNFSSALHRRVSLLLRDNHCFSLAEKVKIITDLTGTQRRSVFTSRLAHNADDKYFLIGGKRIFFDVEHKIHDYEFFMKGITQVLCETYAFPEYFSNDVMLSEGDICLDLGANIGTVSMLFSDIVGKSGKVYAFEPVTHQTLKKNLRENNISNVEVIAKGVSQYPGTTEIEISDFCLDSSIAKREYTKNYYSHKKRIELITLDGFVEGSAVPRIDFIKVDIEGAEELAIRGADRLIEKHAPKWSISSYHTDFNNEPQHDKLVTILKDRGYQIKERGHQHIYAWK